MAVQGICSLWISWVYKIRGVSDYSGPPKGCGFITNDLDDTTDAAVGWGANGDIPLAGDRG